jgi:CDP-paratose synthetase
MSKHLLITGGTGYLGSNLIQSLLNKKYKISVLVRATSSLARIASLKSQINLIFMDDLDDFFKTNSIDAIIHTAASYGRKGEPLEDVLHSNVVFPAKLLTSAIENKVKVFINTDTSLPRDLNYYSLSKAQFKDWLLHLSSQIQIINIIPEYFYGPNDDDSKLVTGVLNKLNNNVESIDFTTGIQERDFIYIEDVVSAYSLILENLDKLEHFTAIPLGTSRTISLRYLVELTKELSKNKTTALNFGKIPIRNGDVMHSKADITLLLSLGWKPITDIKQGLKKIIDLQNI